jgi:hypothetical protein
VTTVLICADSALEPQLSRTPFWRDDLERYVADQADDARMLILSTEPNILVLDASLPGVEALVTSLTTQHLPHAMSIVVLDSSETAAQIAQTQLGGSNTVLPLPAGPEWDARLLDVLQTPTRAQTRFGVSLAVETRRRNKADAFTGMALNISAGGILIDCRGLDVGVGDDVHLALQIATVGDPIEGRGRIVRQPAEQFLGVRFEAFSAGGDARVRDFLARVEAQPSAS